MTAANDQSFHIAVGTGFAKLRVRWLPLLAHWTLDLAWNSTPLFDGRVIVGDTALVRHAAFEYDIAALSLRPPTSDPARSAWGATHQLVLLEPSDRV